MFDKCVDRHKNIWNQLLHLIALILAVYGLWNRNWTCIIIAIVVAILGHLFPHKLGKKKR